MLDTALTVALIAGAVALASTAANVSNARAIERIKSEAEKAKMAAEDRRQISIYSEALARSAFDLQSRLFNILRQDFLGVYLERGSERERAYAVDNTTFLIAQFLCWVELTRQEINFIQLESELATKSLLRKQDDIYATWGTDQWSSIFRIFSGEQRALGEALIVGGPESTTCMGYGCFLEELPRGKNPLIDHIRSQVHELPSCPNAGKERLAAIQHLLIDLIGLVDPKCVRFPESRRFKA